MVKHWQRDLQRDVASQYAKEQKGTNWFDAEEAPGLAAMQGTSGLVFLGQSSLPPEVYGTQAVDEAGHSIGGEPIDPETWWEG